MAHPERADDPLPVLDFMESLAQLLQFVLGIADRFDVPGMILRTIFCSGQGNFLVSAGCVVSESAVESGCTGKGKGALGGGGTGRALAGDGVARGARAHPGRPRSGRRDGEPGASRRPHRPTPSPSASRVSGHEEPSHGSVGASGVVTVGLGEMVETSLDAQDGDGEAGPFMRTPAPSLSGASPPHRCANHERRGERGDAMRERTRAASSRHDTPSVAARLGIGIAGYGAFPAGVRLHSNHSFTGAGTPHGTRASPPRSPVAH